MTRSFTSSDPVAIADYLQAKAVDGTDTDADSVKAMRASLEQALGAISDLRVELAESRQWGDRGWGRSGLLELREDVRRHAEYASRETLEEVLRILKERRVK